MKNDAYGFPESSIAPTSTGGEGDASLALWLGISAAICAAIGPCTCYATYLLCVPLGLGAVYYGMQVKGTGIAYNAGIAGVISGAISALLGILVVGGVGLYLLVVMVAIFAGNM